MRAIVAVLALTLLPAPALADPDDRDDRRPRPAAADSDSRPARGESRAAPAPARGDRDDGRAAPAPAPARGDRSRAHSWRGRARGEARAAPAPAPWAARPRYAARVVSRPWYDPYHPTFWLGWAWGWGYYPLYPRPPYEPDRAREEEERIATRLSFSAGGAPDAAFAGVGLALDGRHAGFHIGIDAVALDRGLAIEDDEAVGWGSAHVTWTVAGSEAFRIRAEAGVSMLSMPGTGAWSGMPYADTVAFGPDVGVSAQLGLVGPIGLEAHARVTPVPVPVTDVRLALALRGGPFALTAGVRTIDVRGDEVDGPEGRFSGPELGFALVF